MEEVAVYLLPARDTLMQGERAKSDRAWLGGGIRQADGKVRFGS